MISLLAPLSSVVFKEMICIVSYFLLVGVVLRWGDLTEASLTSAINTVLADPSYMVCLKCLLLNLWIILNFKISKESIAKLNELILDQPMHPNERAVWWLEYLLR
jgi:UDP-glucoronosyl and UDP-glucosyl transferase